MTNSRILIADPDPDVSHTLELYFENGGHEIKTVAQGEDVLKTARQWQPNAILISTELTGKNPFPICQSLLEDTLTAHIPLIMILHLNERKMRLDALEVGVDDIITKPIDIEELRLRVETAIRLASSRIQV